MKIRLLIKYIKMWTKNVETHCHASLHFGLQKLLEVPNGTSAIRNGVRMRSANATESATWRRGCYKPTT